MFSVSCAVGQDVAWKMYPIRKSQSILRLHISHNTDHSLVILFIALLVIACSSFWMIDLTGWKQSLNIEHDFFSFYYKWWSRRKVLTTKKTPNPFPRWNGSYWSHGMCVCVCAHAPLRVCDPGSSEGVRGHVTVVVKWWCHVDKRAGRIKFSLINNGVGWESIGGQRWRYWLCQRPNKALLEWTTLPLSLSHCRLVPSHPGSARRQHTPLISSPCTHTSITDGKM